MSTTLEQDHCIARARIRDVERSGCGEGVNN